MKGRRGLAFCCAIAACFAPLGLARGAGAGDRVAFDPPLGEYLPVSVALGDERGRRRSLAQWLQGRPAVLVPVYFDCPNLCSLTLAGLARAERTMRMVAGRDFNVLAFSIDPRERQGGMLAARAGLAREAGAERWRLLHADAAAIRSLTRALGFRYYYDERQRQFAHAAGIVVLDAGGRLIQYFPGVSYPTEELEAALLGARGGKVAAVTHRLLLTCFDYDPASGSYSLRIVRLLRIGGIACVLLLAGGVGYALRRERRSRETGRCP